MTDDLSLINFVASVIIIILTVFLIVVVREWQRAVRDQTKVLHEMSIAIQRINTRVEVIDAKVTTGPNV